MNLEKDPFQVWVCTAIQGNRDLSNIKEAGDAFTFYSETLKFAGSMELNHDLLLKVLDVYIDASRSTYDKENAFSLE